MKRYILRNRNRQYVAWWTSEALTDGGYKVVAQWTSIQDGAKKFENFEIATLLASHLGCEILHLPATSAALVESTAQGETRAAPLLRRRCACGWIVPQTIAFDVRNDSDQEATFHISLTLSCPQCGSSDLLAQERL